MPEASDIGRAIGPLFIPNGSIADFKAKPSGTKQKLEIAERVSGRELGVGTMNPRIILSKEHFGSTEGILDGLPDDPTDQKAKLFIEEKI